jgi:ABC-type sugar transport system permease subunit
VAVPAYASDVPATFMYVMSFTRGQIGLGAASATMMLATVAAMVVPYLYSELRPNPMSTDSSLGSHTARMPPPATGPPRWAVLVYAVLLLAALFFLAPLYVMLATSFKDAEQIRSGNLLSLPTSLNFESWTLAWSTACTGVDCRGLQTLFLELGGDGRARRADLHRLGCHQRLCALDVEVQRQ